MTYLQNRATTGDLDFAMSPNAPNRDKVLEKMQNAIQRVAEKYNLVENWMNNQLETYMYPHIKDQIFADAVQQNLLLFKGTNLWVYAAPWDWALARKIKVMNGSARPQDLNDGVHYLYQLNQKRASAGQGILTKAEARQYNYFTTTPISETALTNLATAYRDAYGQDGLAGP